MTEDKTFFLCTENFPLAEVQLLINILKENFGKKPPKTEEPKKIKKFVEEFDLVLLKTILLN